MLLVFMLQKYFMEHFSRVNGDLETSNLIVLKKSDKNLKSTVFVKNIISDIYKTFEIKYNSNSVEYF